MLDMDASSDFLVSVLPPDKMYPFEDIAQTFHDNDTGDTVKPILRRT